VSAGFYDQQIQVAIRSHLFPRRGAEKNNLLRLNRRTIRRTIS